MGSVSAVYVAYKLDQQQNARCLAAFYRDQRNERDLEGLLAIASFWPVVAGVVLAAWSPILYSLAAASTLIPGSWALMFVFPLSQLPAQPGLQFSWHLAQILPQVLLYAQFPLDALLIRRVLGRRTGLFPVCWRVAGLHLGTVLVILMANGAIGQMLAS
jgi:hypothetical protein